MLVVFPSYNKNRRNKKIKEKKARRSTRSPLSFKKKAQVSVFIILGAVALLGASLVIYFLTQDKVADKEEVIVPPNVRPIYDYVVECMDMLGTDAVMKMGSQGGYIHLPPAIKRTPASFVQLDPAGIGIIPYWYYESQDRAPTLEDMQQDISLFIKENVDRCISDFSPFGATFTIETLDQPKVSTFIAEEDVVIKLTYPLSIKAKGSGEQSALSEFVVDIPVRLKKTHDLAYNIITALNRGQLLEEYTLDLISLSSDVPFDGLEFECGSKFWYKDNVKEEIKSLLQTNVPRIRVKNTNHAPFIADKKVYERLQKENEKIKKQLAAGASWESLSLPQNQPDDVWEFNNAYFDVNYPSTNLKANFNFLPMSDVNIEVSPNDGRLLRANNVRGGSKFLRFLCMQQYHFTYDLLYPVVVTVVDEESFGNRGFVFQFATPVIVQDNLPSRGNIGSKLRQDFASENTFCENFGTTLHTFKTLGIYEGYTNVGIPEVNISYECGTQRCDLGTTRGSELQTVLPLSCSNPWIIAEKPGYLKTRVQHSTGTTLDLQLTKLKEMEVDFIKTPYFYRDGEYRATSPLLDTEKALLYIKPLGTEHESYLSFPENNTIEIIDGTAVYEVEIFITDAFGNLVSGFNAKNLTISHEDINSKQKIIFNTIEPRPVPGPNDDQGIQAQYLTIFGNHYQEELRPTFG